MPLALELPLQVIRVVNLAIADSEDLFVLADEGLACSFGVIANLV